MGARYRQPQPLTGTSRDLKPMSTMPSVRRCPSRVNGISFLVPATVTELETRRPPREHPRVADINRIITVHPRTYNEARTIGGMSSISRPSAFHLGRPPSCQTATPSSSQPTA